MFNTIKLIVKNIYLTTIILKDRVRYLRIIHKRKKLDKKYRNIKILH